MKRRPPSNDPQVIVDTIISAKWSVPIIRTLLDGPARFSRIRTEIPAMTANILTSRLRDLEGYGVIQRTLLPPPADCEVYELTSRGEAARPVIMAISHWKSHFLNIDSV